MNTYKDLEKRVQAIEYRNKRVELDKSWETSVVRKILIVVHTYVIIGLFMWYIDVENPWINAIVPTFGFYISTLTLPYFKKIWISKSTH